MGAIHFIKIKFSPGRIAMYKSDATDRPADFQKEVIRLELSVSRIFHKVLNKGRLTEILEKNDFEVLGNLLYKLICRNDDLRDFFLNGLNMTLRDEDSRCRIIFEFEDAVADLAALPWEYILVQANADKNIRQFYLGADKNRQFDLYRSVGQTALPAIKFTKRPTLHLVRAIANSLEKPVEEDRLLKKILALRKKLEKSASPGQSADFEDYIIEPAFKTFPADLHYIVKKFIGDDPWILHYYGHARMDENGPAIGMVLDSRLDWKDAQEFLSLIQSQDFNPPSIVVLQSCESGQIDLYGRGLAILLAQAGIPAVVAMQNEVTEETSCEFIEQFYNAILDGADVAQAVTQARAYLGCDFRKTGPSQYYNNNSFGTPILFISTTEPIRLLPTLRTEKEQQVIRKFICPNCEHIYETNHRETCARGICNAKKLVSLESWEAQAAREPLSESVPKVNSAGVKHIAEEFAPSITNAPIG